MYYYFYLDNEDTAGSGVVSISSTWSPFPNSVTDSEGKKLVICLNGLTVQKTNEGRFASALNNANFDVTFTDCGTTGQIKLYTGNHSTTNQGAVAWLCTASKFTWYNGTVDASGMESSYTSDMGLINVNSSSTFTMYAGKLIGGKAEGAIGGVISPP